MTIAAYERGKSLLPSDRVPALCAVLAISPNELFGGTCRPMPLQQCHLDDDDATVVQEGPLMR